MSTQQEFRSGYIAIVGWPNVGKSSLLNSLLGLKLSIVSPSPQTTKDSILGIINRPSSQMIFVDTPGWLQPKDLYQSSMKKAINKALYDDADVILWVVDPKQISEDEKHFGRELAKIKKPLIIVINKIDSVQGPSLVDDLKKDLLGLFEEKVEIHIASAKTKKGVNDLVNKVELLLPVCPPYFPEDQVTTQWERQFVVELIREQLFSLFHNEVPHASAVVIDEFIEKPDRKDVIQISIYTETEGQKKILIGQAGRLIKQLGTESRKEIEAQLGRPVFLEMRVKVKKNWRKDSHFLNSLDVEAEWNRPS